MNPKTSIQTLALGILGAIVGGTAGYYLFLWIAHQGFYALMIPPAALGWGAGLAARTRSKPLSIGCAIAGFLLAIFTEWQFAPFKADPSFLYFVTHLQSLTIVTQAMIVFGTYFAYSLSMGKEQQRSFSSSDPA